MKGGVSATEDRIRKTKYIAKLALQFSEILSRLNKKSLKLACSAYNHSSKSITETLNSCKKHQTSLTQRKTPKKFSKIERNRLILIERALPTLEMIQEYLHKGILHKTTSEPRRKAVIIILGYI